MNTTSVKLAKFDDKPPSTQSTILEKPQPYISKFKTTYNYTTKHDINKILKSDLPIEELIEQYSDDDFVVKKLLEKKDHLDKFNKTNNELNEQINNKIKGKDERNNIINNMTNEFIEEKTNEYKNNADKLDHLFKNKWAVSTNDSKINEDDIKNLEEKRDLKAFLLYYKELNNKILDLIVKDDVIDERYRKCIKDINYFIEYEYDGNTIRKLIFEKIESINDFKNIIRSVFPSENKIKFDFNSVDDFKLEQTLPIMINDTKVNIYLIINNIVLNSYGDFNRSDFNEDEYVKSESDPSIIEILSDTFLGTRYLSDVSKFDKQTKLKYDILFNELNSSKTIIYKNINAN